MPCVGQLKNIDMIMKERFISLSNISVLLEMGIYGKIFIQLCSFSDSSNNDVVIKQNIIDHILHMNDIKMYEFNRVIEGLRFIGLIKRKDENIYVINTCVLNCDNKSTSRLLESIYAFRDSHIDSSYRDLVRLRGEDIRKSPPIMDRVKPIKRGGYRLDTKYYFIK